VATVFMKWLETTPADYDRGIRLLTLGCLRTLQERIATDYVRPGDRVLEIGCGTGTLAVMMAQSDATIDAIDSSPPMLAEARRKTDDAGLKETITFHEMDASELSDHFASASFDVIVSTLTFSEFPSEVRRYVLDEAYRLLRPGGRLLIIDEVVPDGLRARLLFYALRLPLIVITWLLTRTTTRALRHFPATLAEAGFAPQVVESRVGGSLQLFEAQPAAAAEVPLPVEAIPQLRRRVTLKTVLLDALSLVNRFIPPYPRIATALYRVGNPDRESPVLVTGNYELTARRLVRELDGHVNCWLLIANSRGINVWCAAGGGHFSADDVISAIKTSRVQDVVKHATLILPQLCATGVDGWRIRRETGWDVRWGPVRARDVPAYLAAGCVKTDTMRWVTFPLRDRLEMTVISTIFFGLLLAIPFIIFWPHLLGLTLGALVVQAFAYGVFLPWIPGHDGLVKGIFLVAATVLAVIVWGQVAGDWPLTTYINRSLGLGFLAYFIAGEFQGMSPLMRGEANWDIEAGVGLLTLLAYGASRVLLGT